MCVYFDTTDNQSEKNGHFTSTLEILVHPEGSYRISGFLTDVTYMFNVTLALEWDYICDTYLLYHMVHV